MIEAQDWYENEATGLGRRFRQAIDALIQRMTDNPRQFPVVYKTVRRALLRRFPYSLFFVVEDNTLIVISCFHSSRNPCNGENGPEVVEIGQAHHQSWNGWLGFVYGSRA